MRSGGSQRKVEGQTLPNNVDAVLDQIEAQQEIESAPNGTSLDLLKAVYRRSDLPLLTRVRAATAALPHEHPKLAVTAVVTQSDFADQLERAVERSRMAMIEANGSNTANVLTDTKRPAHAGSNGHKPSVPDRRYRRW
jgi:hypothetical protein